MLNKGVVFNMSQSYLDVVRKSQFSEDLKEALAEAKELREYPVEKNMLK